MDVTVSSRNIELTESLRSAAKEKIGRLDRFVEGMDRAEVHFSEERNPRIADKEVCEVTMEGHGHHIRAKVSAPDAFAAVDAAVTKLEQQLYKLKTKLVGRSHPRHRENGRKSTMVGMEVPNEAGTLLPEEAPAETEDAGIRIVKAKRFAMKPMHPEEAAEHMGLLGHDFYFFSNLDTGLAAVVYRRNDGDVGLIDEAG